jgi:hypothetical protein
MSCLCYAIYTWREKIHGIGKRRYRANSHFNPRQHFGKTAQSKCNVRYELDLRERTIRVEEELKHQRELMQEGFKQMESASSESIKNSNSSIWRLWLSTMKSSF